jgi:hypothetical protein
MPYDCCPSAPPRTTGARRSGLPACSRASIPCGCPPPTTSSIGNLRAAIKMLVCRLCAGFSLGVRIPCSTYGKRASCAIACRSQRIARNCVQFGTWSSGLRPCRKRAKKSARILHAFGSGWGTAVNGSRALRTLQKSAQRNLHGFCTHLGWTGAGRLSRGGELRAKKFARFLRAIHRYR